MENKKMLNNNEVVFELCHPEAVMPTYANEGDAGMDLYTVEDVVIGAGETKIISTGLKMAMPVGKEAQVRPRSGIASSTRLRVVNTPGTIDCHYRDIVGVAIENTSTNFLEIAEELGLTNYVLMSQNSCKKTYPVDKKAEGFVKNANGTYYIPKGTRIAQLVIADVAQVSISQVDNVLDYEGNRGGGWGHTGVK